MKILFVSTGSTRKDKYPNPNYGGQVQIWGLAKEFGRKGHEVGLIRAKKSSQIIEEVEGVKLININTYIGSILNGIPSACFFSYKIYRYIITESPDIVIFRFRLSGLFSSLIDIPKVFVIASPDALKCMYIKSPRSKLIKYPVFKIKNVIENTIMKNCDKIVALNGFMGNYLSKIYSEEKVVKLSNGISSVEYKNNGDANFILFCPGRFDWNKRVRLILQAYVQLDIEARKDYKLVLVGSTQDLEENTFIKSFIGSNQLEKEIEIIPWLERTDLIELMSKCSVLILTSIFEMFPNVVIEAMSLGKVVIASDIPGPQDIITHGYDGYLFDKNDSSQLSFYIDRSIRDPELRARIGSNARNTILSRYDFETVSGLYLHVFEDIINNRATQHG